MSRLPRLLILFLAAISSLSALAYSSTWARIHLWHKVDFPYTRTFLPQNYVFVDLLCFQDRFHYFHRQAFFGIFQNAFNYPPPVALAYRFFYEFRDYATVSYLVAMLLCLGIAVGLFARAMLRRGTRPLDVVLFTAVSLGLSYPFAIAFYLENTELLVWAVLTLGVYAFLKGYGWQAAVLFGIAASFKYFPAIYLALPLAQRKYRDASLVPVVCAAALLGSAWFVGPTLHAVVDGLHAQMLIFQDFYINQFHPLESSIDHSLLGLIKYVLHAHDRLDLMPLLAPAYLAAVAVLGAIVWFLRIRRLPVTNQIMALSVASVLLPPISHDYTLIHLYAPWAMLVLLALSVQRRGMALAFACFALLFTPQSYLIYHDIRFAGQFKAVTLLLLFGTALVFPFAELPEAAAGEVGLERPQVSRNTI